MQIFDSHTHLNDEPYAGKEAAFIQNAADLGVTEMAIVCSDTNLNAGAVRLAQTFDNLYAIVGWHPEFAKDYTPEAEKVMLAQLAQPKTVAMGEIGLDYHWDTSPRDVQRRVLKRQLDLAADLNIPVSIHSRDAFEDTYDILRASRIRDFGGIMHSFTGDAEWARKFLDLGMYISYSGIVSFKNAPEEHESVVVIPEDRLLVETDAPYLTPEPHRGHQNQPGYTRFVAAAVAKFRGDDVAHIAAITRANAHRIFRLGATHD